MAFGQTVQRVSTGLPKTKLL